MSSKMLIALCVVLLAAELQFAFADTDGVDTVPKDIVFLMNVITSPHTSSDPNDASAFNSIKCQGNQKPYRLGGRLVCK